MREVVRAFPIYHIPPTDCPYKTDTFSFTIRRSHEQFQRNCAQVVVPRLGGLDALHEVGLNANTRVLEIEEVDESISSTTIREMLFERGIFWKEAGVRLAKMYSQGDETQKPKNTKPKWDGGDFDADVLTDAMHPDVLRYIEKHSLYG